MRCCWIELAEPWNTTFVHAFSASLSLTLSLSLSPFLISACNFLSPHSSATLQVQLINSTFSFRFVLLFLISINLRTFPEFFKFFLFCVCCVMFNQFFNDEIEVRCYLLGFFFFFYCYLMQWKLEESRLKKWSGSVAWMWHVARPPRRCGGAEVGYCDPAISPFSAISAGNDCLLFFPPSLGCFVACFFEFIRVCMYVVGIWDLCRRLIRWDCECIRDLWFFFFIVIFNFILFYFYLFYTLLWGDLNHF